MALREKLTDRVAPYIQPGEQVQHVFLASGGMNPWLASTFGAIGGALLAVIGQATLIKRRIIAVTDQSVVVLEANFNGTKPKSVVARLPRNTTIGPVKGIWSPVRFFDEKLYIHKKFHKDVRAADSALTA
jgi:hypothetical protein